MTGTWKMHTTLSPSFGIPWRTGCSSTAYCLTVRTTSNKSLQPWEPNPWRCMHNGCLLEMMRNGEQPRWKLQPSSTEYNREWHMTSTPMCTSENLRMLWPGWERTPKILLHASRQWWTAVKWSMMSTKSISCVPISCPQEMPHHLAPKGQGAPQQDGMPGSDHPCRWTHALGILYYLCSESKWQATPVLGSLWPQWGHPLRSSQGAHPGGSHSWAHALSLLHQVGCMPWILVNCPRPGIQPAYNFQQSLWKIPFPVTSLWPCLFPRHLPEEDGPDPRRVPRMHQNHRWHHCPWPHWGRTWCPSL